MFLPNLLISFISEFLISFSNSFGEGILIKFGASHQKPVIFWLKIFGFKELTVISTSGSSGITKIFNFQF